RALEGDGAGTPRGAVCPTLRLRGCLHARAATEWCTAVVRQLGAAITPRRAPSAKRRALRLPGPPRPSDRAPPRGPQRGGGSEARRRGGSRSEPDPVPGNRRARALHARTLCGIAHGLVDCPPRTHFT